MKIVNILNGELREVACVEFRRVKVPLDDSPHGTIRGEFPPEKSTAKIRYGEVSESLAKAILRTLEKGMTAGRIGEHSWTAYTHAEFARKIIIAEQFQSRFRLNREQMAVLNGVPLPELNLLWKALPQGDGGKKAKDFCIKTIYDSVKTRRAKEQRESLAKCPPAKVEMM